ncbi:hypothetical protein PT974_03436 [Cladobotryum mycophilum]|uniref:Transcriptional regulatory protein RXT2 N-terminal domain-containing protein n=1 Tax=Cladobotryum mycophilum TaxID=491253 RepID=A0ABR0SSF5_9HYPO
MASQQVLFAETIAGMKKAFKRKAYESDSDSEIDSYTNRGHKLKRRARFAHKGQLMPTTGPGAYKEAVEYAGVRRSIIHRNPPLLDGDGYEIDSDDDEHRVEEAMLSAAELNPYANIRLEHVLAPLTASTDLPSHPVLSKPFTSNTLTELVSQSCGIMHKENQSLWQVRHLWTSLCGDSTWVPCETMVGQNDIDLYSDELIARHLQSLARPGVGMNASPTALNGEMQIEVPEARQKSVDIPNDQQKARDDNSGDIDISMEDPNLVNKRKTPPKQDKKGETSNAEHDTDIDPDKNQPDEDTNMTNGDSAKDAETQASPEDKPSPKQSRDKGSTAPGEDVQMRLGSEPTSNPRPDQHQVSLTASDDFGETFIHPMFLPPPSAKLDRNLGLPENEAEDIRRLLALYVQKQEEVCRGASRLHQGLLKAERLRKAVLHWAKSEAHCGPNRDMSDGEDWYDKEEWGLTEDLKKGQDEEEEDTTTTGKKTRNRRQ